MHPRYLPSPVGLVALVAGVGLALTFEPVGLAFLLPVALAGFFWCVRGRSARSGAGLGLVFGAGFVFTLVLWLRVIGWDALLALGSFQTLYFAALGAGLARVSRLRWWPLWTAVVWLGVEVVRGTWPLGGFTWGRLGFATIDTPYAGWLPWVGANGTGLVVAGSGALLLWAALWVRERPRPVAGVLAGGTVAVLVPGLLGSGPLGWVLDERGTTTVAVVQGDVPGDGDDLLAYNREVTQSHLDLTRDLGADVAAGVVPQPDLVLWPENSTAVDPFRDRSLRAGIEAAVDAVDAPVMVGAIVDAPDESQVLNQGIVFHPGTGAGDRYTKRHPVAFGEYIPFRAALGSRNFGRLDVIPRDMLSGTRTTPVRVDGLRVAGSICFDIAYDDAIADQVRGGAEILTVQTSNALFIHTGQIEQQFAISRVRALETGRTVVVAAVNGRSGVIGPDGEVVEGIEPRTRSVLVREVGLVGGTPPSQVLGPWLGRIAVLVALIAVAAAGTTRRPALPYRRRRTGRAQEHEVGAR
ncbi:apolipoprotein N-acyltransferase [Nocardioides donggukensis]|uniref:apolipoprotein N-acyltransferase n=1 Tax=Nocardioides donggukensis TaxID=2774019 RepID=UPI00191CC0A2|nr:apolipoprotein N-acyltransferase [Nocardioides donggukensis]